MVALEWETLPSRPIGGMVDEVSDSAFENKDDEGMFGFESEAACLIRSQLPIEPQVSRTNELPNSEHTCFTIARLCGDRRGIPQPALDNFIGLAFGHPRFPLIMLQNPADSHESQCR